MDALADTCFFIDIQRGTNGANEWLAQNDKSHVVASVVTYAELSVGIENRAGLDASLAGVRLLMIDEDCAWIAGQIARRLRAGGRMIGANDIWIAATAFQVNLPILTRNLTEFRRIPGIHVIGY